ncbi:hypothetical protein Taro_000344 [Colocasia esculenta]|uniref:Uncharacterized protein n=1 Tax=Colocasia esculenta TaxID=4460 RepID=A0A843T7L3_COLES|nr:hypothetical protein [Colocasia esculenta]
MVDIPCEALARSREAESCRACYRVNGPKRRGSSNPNGVIPARGQASECEESSGGVVFASSSWAGDFYLDSLASNTADVFHVNASAMADAIQFR